MRRILPYMKHSIIRRIIVIFCLILTIALLSSGAFAYFYSRYAMERQILEDKRQSLNHTARQLDYLVNDIKNVALTVYVDQSMQDYLLSEDYDNYYDNYINSRDVRNMLDLLAVQRDFIYDFAVIKGERILVTNTSTPLRLDESYISKITQEDWFINLLNSDATQGFASVYQVNEGNNKQLLPYVIRVSELSRPSKRIGIILINIDYAYLDDMMLDNSENFDNLIWLDENNLQIFSKDPLPEDLSNGYIDDLINRTPVGGTEVFKVANGYMLIDRTISADWKVAAFIPDSLINQSGYQIIKFFLLYTFIILLVGAAIISLVVTYLTRPLASLTRAMEQVSDGNIDMELTVERDDEIGALSAGFNKMLLDIRQYLQQTIQHEKDKRHFQSSLLMAQINPHFIYNTLHTIIYMAKKVEATDIVDMTRSFISVLHDAVKISDGRLFVSLKQELDVVDKYLIIQKYRYRDRFAVEYELDESLDDCLVPKTILQPLVENSLLHGILPTAKAGRIKISTIAGNESMTIQIEDDGAGMSREAIDKLMNENQDMQASAIHTDNAMRSIGLPNVHQRIQYLCGENYGLAIDSEPGRFTRISISLPINRVIPEQK